MGKGAETKSSRIFLHCYLKCCKLQNINPLTYVVPSDSGKSIDFCVDRIKYVEWGPILNALSSDLSLHSISIRCRQQVKTVLENVDNERLAKTVNKRAVILTRFVLSNFIEAVSLCLANSTLLTNLLLEGFPLKENYLNPLIEALNSNSSLQHISLPRCLIGDVGCNQLCKALRLLPNVLTLDLSGCEITPKGAESIAELVKYQKIHRYSENWIHTLRYRLPQLDSMAGLRRISLCGNTGLGDIGAAVLMDVLGDDLWIKALDLQCCGLSEASATVACQMLKTNTSLVVLDMRYNSDIANESLTTIRIRLKENQRDGFTTQQYRWLCSNMSSSSGDSKSKVSITRSATVIGKQSTLTHKYPIKSVTSKKEKEYAETLEEQLKEEMTHRRQLEELNIQLVEQIKSLKHQQIRMWNNDPSVSSGINSERSCEASDHSYEVMSQATSDSSSSVPIDLNTLSYIQHAFKDIYSFIKDNQCQGECYSKSIKEVRSTGQVDKKPKKAQSMHIKIANKPKHVNKTTKSAHAIREQAYGENTIIERQIGDTKCVYRENPAIVSDIPLAQKSSPNFTSSSASSVSESSATVICTPRVNCTQKISKHKRSDYTTSEEET